MRYAETASSLPWSEDVKVDLLGNTCLASLKESPTVEHVMPRMLETFNVRITLGQSMNLFIAPKYGKRTWTEHYLYLVYLVVVREACGGADNLVLDNLVLYRKEAEEQFAQSAERDMNNTRHMDKDMTAAVSEAKPKPRKCYVCGSEKHLTKACPNRNNVSGKRSAGYSLDVFDTALVAPASRDTRGYWILDSGSSGHLVDDERLLKDPRECANVCLGAGGEEPLVEKQGNVLL
ncbi:hypothetical protein PHMEG_00027251 [Phytophthora megakarya]|uniref:CCHC-type domain-containing protein n=1 Tax=Phytophthora megakarya TaxID=4795 RepID=A0A225V7M5_9STRA|nr:hypothetical protein PHMEG_00027251 [Phytophthora megakarya]